MKNSPIQTTFSNAKPVRRSERMKKSAPERVFPKRESLIELFARYDVQAPRYTSYPSATQFNNSVGPTHYRDLLRHEAENTERQAISLYIHIPFCDTLCYFCGCTMVISNNREKIAEYLNYLKREITMVASELTDSDPTVVQMHWGGGSPTHLLPCEIEDLGMHIRKSFSFSNVAELSIEIDPRGITPEHIAALQIVGFNRASIGVQDFDHDVQLAINRVQSRDLTERVIGWCREAGMASINLDLIYGLPYQTPTTLKATLKAIKELSPERIAVYNFAYVPWLKPHQSLIQIETLPQASSKLALLELAIGELTEAGYTYLGMDHFAKPNDALFQARKDGTLRRNFQGYSTMADTEILAFGISAIGRIENTFVQNAKEMPKYYAMIDAGLFPIERGYTLTLDDEIREYVIMELMCNLQVSKRTFKHLFGVSFTSYFNAALPGLALAKKNDLCIEEQDEIRITETGRFFLRNIALLFDRYSATGEKRFSRAI